MNRISRCQLLGLLLISVCVGAVSAQEHGGYLGRPGGYFNGRHIGYVPKHEKVDCQAGCAVCAEATVPPLESEHAHLLTVDQVNYQQPVSVSEDAHVDGVDIYEGQLIDENGEYLETYPDSYGPTHPKMETSTTSLIYGGIEYLHWWTTGMDIPALVTTSPAADQGILGAPGTSVLFGEEGLNQNGRPGGRLTLGRMLNPDCGQGLEVTFLRLAEESEQFVASGADYSVLARPFFNTVSGQQDSRRIVFPGVVEGSLNVISSTEFETFQAVFRQVYAEIPGVRADYFFGYRYADLKDFIRVNEATVSLSGPTIGSTFSLYDQFESENKFHGGEFGIRIIKQKNFCWSFECSAQIALGNTQSLVQIDGQTVATARDGSSTTTDVGLLTQESNIGEYQVDKFSGIAEFGINARRHFVCGLDAKIGYTAFFWSDVIRAGDQMDLDINTTQIPPGQLQGPPAPIFPAETSSFWAHGLNVGLEYSY